MRLLIVSPHFPPSNAADMQRIRLILPYLKEAGVEAEVLGVEAEEVASPRDPWLVSGLPSDVLIHRVRALGLGWSRVPGLGILSFRALGALRRRGNELLRSGKFDLVYFSTTQFGIHVLGPFWMKRYGVPFVMDYQDPWVSNFYRENAKVTPPGGRFKYAMMDLLNRRNEPRVLKECSGITSVSRDYPRQIAKRYNFLKLENYDPSIRGEAGIQDSGFKKTLRSFVVPFPGDDRDFERLRAEGITQRVFDPKDGLRHWVYVGRGGKDMETAVRGIFRAIKKYGEGTKKDSGLRIQDSGNAEVGDKKPEIRNLKPETRHGEGMQKDADKESGLGIRDEGGRDFLKTLRIYFIGTSYAGAGRGVKSIEPIAIEEGIGGVVSEHPDRIPYSETLRCLLDADALVVPGSNDPAYTASKIYPYLLAGKPLLTVFHDKSSVVSLIRSVGGGVVIPFATGEETESIAERIQAEWLVNHQYEQAVPLNWDAFAPNTARAQAGQLAEFFRSILNLL